MLILGLRILVPLCEHSKEYWNGFCICYSRREKGLGSISTWWYFRYQFRRRHNDGSRHLLPMLLQIRFVSIIMSVSCVQRWSLFPALATERTHNTSPFLAAFQKHWWILVQNIQAVGFRTWDFRASFLTTKWEQWLFLSPTIFDSLCFKTKYVLYYIYHMQASGKMLLLKLFFNSFCMVVFAIIWERTGRQREEEHRQSLSLPFHHSQHDDHSEQLGTWLPLSSTEYVAFCFPLLCLLDRFVAMCNKTSSFDLLSR